MDKGCLSGLGPKWPNRSLPSLEVLFDFLQGQSSDQADQQSQS